MVGWIEGGAGFFLFSVLPGGAVELPGRSRPAPGVVAIRWGAHVRHALPARLKQGAGAVRGLDRPHCRRRPFAKPERPQGIERNLVITMWDWGSGKHYLHDVHHHRFLTTAACGGLRSAPDCRLEGPSFIPRTVTHRHTNGARDTRPPYRTCANRSFDHLVGAPGITAATPSGLMLKAKNVKGVSLGFPH